MPMRLVAILLWTSFVSVSAIAAEGEPVTIIAARRDPLPVIVSASASERVRSAAETLASYLEKMSREKFSIVSDVNAKGIRVGRLADFPHLRPEMGEQDDPTRREDYWLKSHAQGLDVIGTTDLAVEHAVWDLLSRLPKGNWPMPGLTTWSNLPQSRNRNCETCMGSDLTLFAMLWQLMAFPSPALLKRKEEMTCQRDKSPRTSTTTFLNSPPRCRLSSKQCEKRGILGLSSRTDNRHRPQHRR